MKKYIISGLTFFLISINCCGQTILKIPNGTWINAEDSLDIFVVKGKWIFDYYGDRLEDSSKYIITRKSCDKSFKLSNKKKLFLQWGDLCYEVDGITKDYIELFYMSNKRTITYWRKNSLKRLREH